MLFNIIIVLGGIIMYFTYVKSIKYKEGCVEYLTLQNFFNLGFWMIFSGIIIQGTKTTNFIKGFMNVITSEFLGEITAIAVIALLFIGIILTSIFYFIRSKNGIPKI